MSDRGCATCNRVILVEHADEDGNCFYCAPESFDETGQPIQRKQRYYRRSEKQPNEEKE